MNYTAVVVYDSKHHDYRKVTGVLLYHGEAPTSAIYPSGQFEIFSIKTEANFRALMEVLKEPQPISKASIDLAKKFLEERSGKPI